MNEKQTNDVEQATSVVDEIMRYDRVKTDLNNAIMNGLDSIGITGVHYVLQETYKVFEAGYKDIILNAKKAMSTTKTTNDEVGGGVEETDENNEDIEDEHI